jgi:hypothetical protein
VLSFVVFVLAHTRENCSDLHRSVPSSDARPVYPAWRRIERTLVLSLAEREQTVRSSRNAAHYAVRNRIAAKSDELTHIESYSYAKPPGEGARGEHQRAYRITRHSSLGTKPLRINTSTTSRICIKTNDFNLLRIRTSKPLRVAHKTKDFKSTRINTYASVRAIPFRIRTSKKTGGEGVQSRGFFALLATRHCSIATRHLSPTPTTSRRHRTEV